MLESFIQWLLDRFRDLGYPGIVILMAIESSFLPLPSELVMPPAGYLAAKGELNFVLAIVCGVAGSITGALANYGRAPTSGRDRSWRARWCGASASTSGSRNAASSGRSGTLPTTARSAPSWDACSR